MPTHSLSLLSLAKNKTQTKRKPLSKHIVADISDWVFRFGECILKLPPALFILYLNNIERQKEVVKKKFVKMIFSQVFIALHQLPRSKCVERKLSRRVCERHKRKKKTHYRFATLFSIFHSIFFMCVLYSICTLNSQSNR